MCSKLRELDQTEQKEVLDERHCCNKQQREGDEEKSNMKSFVARTAVRRK
jgi:hypothetical protein